MAIRLTPRNEAQVEEILTNGHFSDAEEVIDVALELLSAREQRIARLETALVAAEKQVEEGRTIPHTPQLIERLKQEAIENSRQLKPINNDLIF
jgi:Arc/MetJ-type ribon-helix-helix transcriptional regulator